MTTILNTCDDCRKTYPGMPYYRVDPEDCSYVSDEIKTHVICTGNLCPDCAGPFLVPDEPLDPRRPLASNLRARAAMEVLIAQSDGR